jgi:hypothetical protein
LEYPFEDFDCLEEQYIGQLALLHKEHMEYFSLGYIINKNFIFETVQDVYSNNFYALSWFYEGIYPFNSYEPYRIDL